MKPPMGNMYSFCSHFASASEAIDIKSFFEACSKSVPLHSRVIDAEGLIDRNRLYLGASIRRGEVAETHA